MRRAAAITGLALAAAFLASATPADTARDWLRRGNAAFEQGDYEGALACYAEAEDGADDPGQVAFNEAAALYRLGRYREAEQHYLRCRDEATGDRLARLLFDLGNTLVLQSQGREAGALRRAVAAYVECLKHAERDSDLAKDAAHNHKVAAGLLQAARARHDETGNDDNPPEDPGHKDDRRPPGVEDESDPGRGAPNPRSGPSDVGDPYGQPGAQAIPTDRPSPGTGNLPPIPDAERMVPMTPDETAAYLRSVAARLLRERREYRQRAGPPPPPNMKDW